MEKKSEQTNLNPKFEETEKGIVEISQHVVYLSVPSNFIGKTLKIESLKKSDDEFSIIKTINGIENRYEIELKKGEYNLNVSLGKEIICSYIFSIQNKIENINLYESKCIN